MQRNEQLSPEFVDLIPDVIESGKLYVSMEYATVIHLCCCGCGMKVVTPLSPTDWKLFYDGRGISLEPSIGSWSLDCKSHYFIRNNRIQWAGRWSRKEIEAARRFDQSEKARYFSIQSAPEEESGIEPQKQPEQLSNWYHRLFRFVRSLLGKE